MQWPPVLDHVILRKSFEVNSSYTSYSPSHYLYRFAHHRHFLPSHTLTHRNQQNMSSNTVTATINYFTPPADGSQPWTKVDRDPVTGEQATNWKPDPREQQIENVRGQEQNYTLDTAGFSYHVGPSALAANDFDSDEVIKERYYPESIDYLKKVTGAAKVVLFDHSEWRV